MNVLSGFVVIISLANDADDAKSFDNNNLTSLDLVTFIYFFERKWLEIQIIVHSKLK